MRFPKHVFNWLVATLYEASAFGYATEVAEEAGYKKELDTAIVGLRETHRRIVVLPGGDYGFAWIPHRTYARDLEHFTKLLGFTAQEAIIVRSRETIHAIPRNGTNQAREFADCVVVDGDSLKDITILQDHAKLDIIMINGRVHKAGCKEVMLHPDQRVSDKIAKHKVLDKVGISVPMLAAY